MPKPPPPRIHIQYPQPAVDAGLYPAKRTVGDLVEVSTDVFRDGHEKLRAVICHKPAGARRWRESELQPIDAHINGVRWAGSFVVDAPGRWDWTVEAWTDHFATWRDELRRKLEAGQHDLSGELSEGVLLLQDAAGRASGADKKLIEHALRVLEDEEILDAAKHDAALGQELYAAIERNAERHGATRLEPGLALEVDRVRARFGAWYELFPRSFGGLQGVEAQLPRLRELGFDVIYVPPIHPIGHTNRKGRNNALVAGPDDPGSPYAIGSELGGHDAVEPSLGTLDDVRALCAAAAELEMDIALDLAINCSPDHPWLKEHPDWFFRRPDGTLKYAENPPKKYQDIYNVNFQSEDWRAMWDELRRVVLMWVGLGVKVFRVDNPHTKPLPFWAWLIAEVHRVDRDVIFLSEAFTRPKMMKALAKAGFTQSYSYFTWRNFKGELVEYFTELTQTRMKEYYRANLFPNTPDILPGFLQRGGRPAFMIRAILATTLSSVYGIYSGFELCENRVLAPGKEEYLDSEKYEIKAWDWERPGNIRPLITRLNQVRRANPALQEYDNLRFHPADGDSILFYGKMLEDRTSMVFVAVNLDPFQAHETVLHFPLQEMGIGWGDPWEVEELLTGERHFWQGADHWLRLEPDAPGRIYRVRAWRSSETGFDYFMPPTLV